MDDVFWLAPTVYVSVSIVEEIGVVMFAFVARQFVVIPLFCQLHDHDHGPLPKIDDHIPLLQRFTGCEVRVFPSSDQHTQWIIFQGAILVVLIELREVSVLFVTIMSHGLIFQLESNKLPVEQNHNSICHHEGIFWFQVSGKIFIVVLFLVIFPDHRLVGLGVSNENFQFSIPQERVFFKIIFRQYPVFQSLEIVASSMSHHSRIWIIRGWLTSGRIGEFWILISDNLPDPLAQNPISIVWFGEIFSFHERGVTLYTLPIELKFPFQELEIIASFREKVIPDHEREIFSVFFKEIFWQNPVFQSLSVLVEICILQARVVEYNIKKRREKEEKWNIFFIKRI